MNLSAENIVKYIKYLIYALVIAVPLAYFPTIMMPFQLSKTVIFQILAELIFVLWLGLAIFNKEYRPKITPLTSALVIFMAVVSFSVIFGSDWRAGLWSDQQRSLGLVALFHFFALFLAVSSMRSKINWSKLWTLSFWTAVTVSLIGISQKFIVFSKDANPWLHIVYSAIPDRVGSTFSNSAFMAGYLLFNLFIGLWILLKIEKRKTKSMTAVGLILILIAILLSQTLGVMLGLTVGILFFLAYFSFKKTAVEKKIRLGVITSLVLLISFGGVLALTKDAGIWQKIPGVKRVANFSLQNESINGRLITWNLSLKAFKEKPLLGWGFENFRIAFNKYYDPLVLASSMSGTYWDKPHNIVLEYLVNTGILGLLAYLSIFIAAFYTLIKNSKVFNYTYEFSIVSALLISYFVQNLFIFDTIGTYLMFFLTLAFIDGYSNNSAALRSDHQMDIRKNSGNLLIKQKFAFVILLAISLVSINYNYKIFKSVNYEYWGVNYFLNQLKESSLVSFSRAVNMEMPYGDDIRKTFANTVRQAYQQGMIYPNLEELQKKLADYLKLTIERHPKDFYYHITLAEFYNTFYEYDSNYVKEAEDLTNKALELSPKRQQIYYVLAKTRLLKGDVQGAYDVFEKTVNLNPNAADPHFYFGLMAYGLGDSKKGAEQIAMAERLGRFPQKVEDAVILGNFAGDLDHNYKKAIEYYNYAKSLSLGEKDNRNMPNILLKLAIAHYFDGTFNQSRQTFLELSKVMDIKSLVIYPDLKPVLQELGIEQ